MWRTMDEATLKSKKVAELKEIAKTFGLEGYTKMKKAELIDRISLSGEAAFTAERTGWGWQMTEPVRYPLSVCALDVRCVGA